MSRSVLSTEKPCVQKQTASRRESEAGGTSTCQACDSRKCGVGLYNKTLGQVYMEKGNCRGHNVQVEPAGRGL